MVKGWQASGKPQQGGWGQAQNWPSQPGWSNDDRPRPPQQPPPYNSQQKGGWKKQLPQPGKGKGKAAEADVAQEEFNGDGMEQGDPTMGGGWGEEPAQEMTSTESFLTTELAAVQPRPGETERQAKVRAMAERIRAEAKRARGETTAPASQPPAKKSAADTAAERQQEEHDAQKLEAMLPKLEERIAAAEDEAEKVAILAAPLAMEAVEELRELQLSAVRETERAVKAALATAGKIRRDLDVRKKEGEAMAPLAKERAREELDKLISRMDAAQAKLDEHKNVRKDHELALQAEKLFGELASRLAGVEIDCEKAAMMAEPLSKALDTNPQDINAAEIRETKEALRVAQATLAPTMRLISGKVSGLKGTVRSKMLDLQSRAEASQALLDKTQRTVEEAQSRAAAIPILKQAQERAATIQEVLQKMRETEAPFLMGIETMPPEEASEVLSKMDKASALAQSALADATKYVSLKTVEVGRLAEGAAEAARRELDRVKQQLDEGVARVKAFQAEAAKRRRMNLVEVVKAKIEEAESAVSKMKDAGSELQSTETGSLASALEKAHAAELEAQNAVTTARRELQERQQDLRPHEGGNPDAMKSGSEILRTKVRVNYMEAELTKFRKLAKEFEEKIKVGKSLTDVLDSLREAEEEVERISSASQEWPKDAKPPEEADKSIASTQNKLSATTVQVETKLQSAQGLELKELRGIFGRLQKSQVKLDKVKNLSRDLNRSLSMQVVKEAADAVQKAEASVASLSGLGGLAGMSMSRLTTLHQQASVASEAIGVAKEALAQGSSMETAAKVEFARLQLRFKAVDRKGRAAADAITAAFERAGAEATHQALDALRSAARREDGSYDSESFFVELSDGTGEITEEQFCNFFTKRKGEFDVPAEKVKLAFKRIAPHGLMRRTFISALADFLKVVRDITVTDEFAIQSAKKVRKLEMGEVLEALGESKDDASLGLQRVKCRAIRDGTTGWVTVRSTGGASYLQRVEKPFLWCADTVAVRASPEAQSAMVREVKAGEVLELVEGPREERLGSDMRVRGIACSDETRGWLQVRDKSGGILAKPSATIYKCNEAIAMTDTADFDNCTMIRRIDTGEALELISSEKQVKPSEGGTRSKFRACRDGAEGWVTVHGSQGTVYVKQAPKHYVCVQASPIHAGVGAESAVVRVLMPGEAFAGFEEPKEVAGGERLTTYKVRAVIDGKEGWVTSTAAEVMPWSTQCKILRTVQLTKGFPANEAAEVIEVVRLLEPGEVIEVTEQPTEDSSSGQLRACCVALKDKAVGWVTVREGSSLLMSPVPANEAAASAAPTSGEAAPTTPPAQAPAATKRPLTASGKGQQKGKAGAKPSARSSSPPLKRQKGKGKGK